MLVDFFPSKFFSRIGFLVQSSFKFELTVTLTVKETAHCVVSHSEEQDCLPGNSPSKPQSPPCIE